MNSPSDTSNAAHAAQVAAWGRMGPQRRLETALRMSDDLRLVALAGIRHRHPEYAVEDARWALWRFILGDELFGRAFPDAPVLPA
ncbi:MAG: hypothetical protein H6735_23775 [Alphaproteobacteria bacterium]|nr:hypothetical protein [Alphaproteobacteria bacterium]